jgi:hypothetical protein
MKLTAYWWLLACLTEDGGSKFCRSVAWPHVFSTSHPRRQYSSNLRSTGTNRKTVFFNVYSYNFISYATFWCCPAVYSSLSIMVWFNGIPSHTTVWILCFSIVIMCPVRENLIEFRSKVPIIQAGSPKFQYQLENQLFWKSFLRVSKRRLGLYSGESWPVLFT